MEKETYHVKLRADGKWVGQREGMERPSVISDDKEEALQQAIEIAAIRKAQVLVYDSNGNLQAERSYPRRRRAWR